MIALYSQITEKKRAQVLGDQLLPKRGGKKGSRVFLSLLKEA